MLIKKPGVCNASYRSTSTFVPHKLTALPASGRYFKMNPGVPSDKTIIRHVAIAGNIGAGKTTLCEMLAKHFGWDVHYEDAENNPYLSDFYMDMKRWSFNLQVFFLSSRYQQVLRILQGHRTVIQDRTIYEDAFIFAPNLADMGLMERRDFENYLTLFQSVISQVKAPDLLIYLKASIPTLVEHIQMRGRDYEGSISLEYLKRLNDRYDSWINSYREGKLLIINVDQLDFSNNKEDSGRVLEMVQAELHGLF